MHQLNIQLYARCGADDFTEELSVRGAVVLTPDPHTIGLRLDAPEGKKFVELRLDPDDKSSIFALHGLKANSASGAELFRWDGNPDSLFGKVNIQAWQAEGQVVLECSSEDPFFRIPLPAPQSTVEVELSVSSIVLSDHPEELAEAVRSLQSRLSHALDDLSNEQESLQETVLLGQANTRTEIEAINRHVRTLGPVLEEQLQKARNEVLKGVRDDWRSVRTQIADVADLAHRRDQERHRNIISALEAEVAKLLQAVSGLSASQAIMDDVRHELGVRRSEDAIPRLRQLKEDAQAARSRIEAVERSLAWRITSFFRSFSTPERGSGRHQDEGE